MAVFLGSGGQVGVPEADLGPALSWTWRLPSTLGVKYYLGMYFCYEIWMGACACVFRQGEVRERSAFTLPPQTWRPSNTRDSGFFSLSHSALLMEIWGMRKAHAHVLSESSGGMLPMESMSGIGNERLVTRTAFHSPPLTRSHSPKWKNENKPSPPDRIRSVCAVCYKEQKLRKCCFQRSVFIDGPAVFEHWIMSFSIK